MPRTVLHAVASVALAVGLAGCSDANPAEEVRTGGSGGTSSGSPGPGAGSEPGGSGGTGQVGPLPPVTGVTEPPTGDTLPPIGPDPDSRRHAQPWDGHSVGADGRTLTFTYYAGVAPCSLFDSIVADEGSGTVRVTIYERSGPDGVACIMLAQQKSASVTLDAPLGARTLVDGAI